MIIVKDDISDAVCLPSDLLGLAAEIAKGFASCKCYSSDEIVRHTDYVIRSLLPKLLEIQVDFKVKN